MRPSGWSASTWSRCSRCRRCRSISSACRCGRPSTPQTWKPPPTSSSRWCRSCRRSATLVLALIDSMNDYKIKAHHMHACALSVNDLLQELRLLQTNDPGDRAGLPPALQRGGARLPLQSHARRLPDGCRGEQGIAGGQGVGAACATRSTSTACTALSSPRRRWCCCCLPLRREGKGASLAATRLLMICLASGYRTGLYGV